MADFPIVNNVGCKLLSPTNNGDGVNSVPYITNIGEI